MKVVIDIDENVFTRLFDNGTEDYEIVNDDLFKIAKSIRKGTPLPKGHGRLIDSDKLISSFPNYDGVSDVIKTINYTDTIIEADKEVEEEWHTH